MKISVKRIIEGCIILAGILLFSLFIHRDDLLRLLAFIFLCITAFGVHIASRDNDLLKTVGLTTRTSRLLIYLFLGGCIGSGLAMVVRYTFDMPWLPEHLTYVALIAPLIGITEELVFRGYIQGHFRPLGRLVSMGIATAGHTLYKYIVIATLQDPVDFNFRFLILWTFLGGFMFSILRECSRSIYPSALAHACFDIILYGAFASLPFWTWR